MMRGEKSRGDGVMSAVSFQKGGGDLYGRKQEED